MGNEVLLSGNNPVKYVDPDGRAVVAVPWIVKGAIALGNLGWKAYKLYRGYQTAKALVEIVQEADLENILAPKNADSTTNKEHSDVDSVPSSTIPGLRDNEQTDNNEFKSPKDGSGKEKASDVPSWAKGEKPFKTENGRDFAKRLMDKQYGEGNYKTGPGSEYNKIQKWGDRGFE